MRIRPWLLVAVLLSAAAVFVSGSPASAAYEKYDFTSGRSNYHIEGLELSGDGKIGIGIGGTGVVASSEVAVFTPKSDGIAWRFNPSGDKVIFDVDISEDGSTIVACGSAVWVIDVASHRVLWRHNAGVDVYDTCTLSADGGEIVAGNRQSEVKFWHRGSSAPARQWEIPDGDFLNVVTISRTGSRVLAATDETAVFMDTAADGFVWEKNAGVNSVVDADISGNGKQAFIIQQRDAGGYGAYTVRGLSITDGSSRWTRAMESFNTPSGEMSNDGRRIAVVTNDAYYGLTNARGLTAWKLVRSGDDATVAMSGTGQFVVVTEGDDFIFLIDWTYPSKSMKPYHIRRGVFPNAAAISADGSTIAYSVDDLHVEQVPPGILVGVGGVPVYEGGDEVSLSYHVTNPGPNERLRATVSLTLPQVDLLNLIATPVSSEATPIKSKLLEYAQRSLPGYRVGDTYTFNVDAHDSATVDRTFEMPNLVLPGWAEDILSGLGLDEVFDFLLGDYSDPVKDLTNRQFRDAMWSRAAELQDQITYPLIGIGQVQLRDSVTSQLYSHDTFFFMYVL